METKNIEVKMFQQTGYIDTDGVFHLIDEEPVEIPVVTTNE